MKDAAQIGAFGKSVDAKLAAVRRYLPEDLVIARTSDQPLQVKENISLFMDALYEAILLVVLVSWHREGVSPLSERTRGRILLRWCADIPRKR